MYKVELPHGGPYTPGGRKSWGVASAALEKAVSKRSRVPPTTGCNGEHRITGGQGVTGRTPSVLFNSLSVYPATELSVNVN